MTPKLSFSMRPEDYGDSAAFFCSGGLTLETADSLKDEVKKWIPGRKQIALDFQGVNRMDSSGIGALIALYIHAKKQNCEFFLVNYSESIRDLLGMTHLLSILEAHGRSGTRLP
jgi:anti-anti-sigma factor